MARQRVLIEATAVYSLDLELYADAWQEHCDETHEGDEPLTDYPPVPLEFALKRFKEELEENGDACADALEGATIDVKAAD